ncbi:MAG: hypothetical protein ACREMP_02115 [Candidatus Tyrphobacter sp.]
MSKRKRAVGAGRMTQATIAAVVAEIEAYGRGERSGQLSWKALCAFSGFSHVSLWKKPAIKTAFADIQQARRVDATPNIKAPKSTDERVAALKMTVDKLEGTIQAYDELWALYEYNVHRMGWDPEELRRPMDPTAREAVRRPHRLQSVR